LSASTFNFDFTNAAVLLRVICSLFFIPHLFFKIVGDPPPALEVFTAAGFKPPKFYMRLAIVVEIVAGLGLFLGIYTQWAALLAAASLSVAAGAICSVNRSMKWMWNLGGMEYLIFWALTCVAVAMLHWT
jgi:putative oxidoreductase